MYYSTFPKARITENNIHQVISRTERMFNGCVISKFHINKHGYPILSVPYFDNDKRTKKIIYNVRIDQLMYLYSHNMLDKDIRNIPLIHTCGNKRCINPDHLQLAETPKTLSNSDINIDLLLQAIHKVHFGELKNMQQLKVFLGL